MSSNLNTFAPENELEPISPDTFRFIAVDVETANSNKHSICQIGLAMAPYNGEIQTASFLIDPDEWFDDFNITLHGIDGDRVEGAPNFNTVIQAIRPLLERHTLIQHSSFDKLAFDAACKLNGLPNLRANWLDSVIIARSAWPELKGNGGHGLASLKNHLGLDFEHHDAEEDARAAAEVVLLAESRTSSPFCELAMTARQKRQNNPVSVALDKA